MIIHYTSARNKSMGDENINIDYKFAIRLDHRNAAEQLLEIVRQLRTTSVALNSSSVREQCSAVFGNQIVQDSS